MTFIIKFIIIKFIIILLLVNILLFILKYKKQNYSKELFSSNNPIITFIIPSIGRSTITRTIKSLQNLNNPNWEAIVVFDGVKSNITHIKDSRIKYYEKKKTGSSNMGGSTRNYGIHKVKKSEWIGFVDDDDTLSPNYINSLLDNKNVDCIIYRMYNKSTDEILPHLDSKTIKKNSVGISFGVKKDILKKNNFKNSPTEDYDLLYKLNKNKKYKILLSKDVTYFIRMDPLENVYNNMKGTQILNPPF